MPRLTPARREQQRARIVDSARRVMLRRGLAGTSMSQVIEESGLSAGAIYGYFTGKDELVAAVALEVIRRRTSTFAEIAERTPVPPPHVALGGFLAELPEPGEGALVLEIWALVGREQGLQDLGGEVFAEIARGAQHYLAAWYQQDEDLDEEQATRRATRATPALLALAQGYIVQSALLGPSARETFGDSIAALLADRPEEER
ncbi:transcriptional regulator, TetR family [Kytococcus aerolatus]|uniref:Transcriptional regulator, TetR family n=1 Tax=Kytococcus aerolatus TaxID=592308 RepID=A0A212TBB0_9MICO|nr:TetR/AcrR family transcriptional regulator [Kytococcus aerolatus]SNC63302.1 transcriptional regulator, TetR family [Kytococcus aerolatus]